MKSPSMQVPPAVALYWTRRPGRRRSLLDILPLRVMIPVIPDWNFQRSLWVALVAMFPAAVARTRGKPYPHSRVSAMFLVATLFSSPPSRHFLNRSTQSSSLQRHPNYTAARDPLETGGRGKRRQRAVAVVARANGDCGAASAARHPSRQRARDRGFCPRREGQKRTCRRRPETPTFCAPTQPLQRCPRLGRDLAGGSRFFRRTLFSRRTPVA